MSQELIDQLKRSLLADPDNPFIKRRLSILLDRCGQKIKAKEPIPKTLVLDYLFSGDSKATLQWNTEGGKRHLVYSIRQHTRKKGKKIIKRLPIFSVWYREASQQYTFLCKLERTGIVTKATCIDMSNITLAQALHHIMQVIESKPGYDTYHDGNCGQCAIELTHPESIRRGIGPICFRKMTEEKRADV